jgi:hypothetical protein
VVHALTDKTAKAKILYIHTVISGARMFVELVYDKRNVEGLEGAREIILAELTKRVHQIFPDAEVKVKPMQANGLNSDASKSDREKLNRMLEEMFEESDMWLVSEFPNVRQVGL